MKRRQLIKASLAGGMLVGLGGGALWLTTESEHRPLTLAAALANLERLTASMRDAIPETSGTWNLAQILTHCAQSVEYSMQGFPQHKSELFKQTAGALAFTLFSSKGQMMHALDEPIPGAGTLNPEQALSGAAERFRLSLLAFDNFDKPLAPHFAYGELSKSDYERAHVMHFYNHLQEVS